MKPEIKEKIEKEYGLNILKFEQAPRQFVAETWFIDTNKGKYFVKIVEKDLFIPEIIKSLPVLRSLHENGIDRINYPLETKNKELYVDLDGTLITIYNFIDGKQTYEYSEAALGRVLAGIHKISQQIKVYIRTETYEFKFKQKFEDVLEGMLNGSMVTDEISKNLSKLFSNNETVIRERYMRLNSLSIQMRELNLEKVITHGDAGGNTLMTTPNNIYVIDWDGILLAPPERDMWIPRKDFLIGYREIIPGFEANKTSLAFYTYHYYFESLIHYLSEILPGREMDHRRKNLTGLETEMLNGWIIPFINKYNT